MVIGYKCFNEDMTNRYDKKFEVGKTYSAEGEVSFGNEAKYGFHMCQNMEDTFRCFDAIDDSISICLVKGSGQIVENEDNYYGYYEMYSVETLEILKKLSREEIISYALNLHDLRVERFISTFKLNSDEIEIFKEKFKNNERVLQYIEYYQLNNSDAFKILRK